MKLNNDIYINEPHISGGVPIVSKTDKGVRFHEHDFLGTTLWSFDLEGKIVDDYQDTTVFGEGRIQNDRAARFTGKPYDKEMGAYIFPYRNYDPTTMRWRSADPSGYPDGINNQFYACVPTMSIDPWGLEAEWYINATGNYNELTDYVMISDGGGAGSSQYRFAINLSVNISGSGTNSVKVTTSANVFLESRYLVHNLGTTNWQIDSDYSVPNSYTNTYSVDGNGSVCIEGDVSLENLKKSEKWGFDSTGIALAVDVPTGGFSPEYGYSWNQQIAARGAYEDALSGSLSLGSIVGIAINFSGATLSTETLSKIVNFTLLEK